MRSFIQHHARWFSCLMFAALAGCGAAGGPAGGGGAGTPTPVPTGSPKQTPEPTPSYGATVSLGTQRLDLEGQATQTIAFASAVFYRPAALTGNEKLPEVDDCVLQGPAPGPTPQPLSYRDVGETMSLVGPKQIALVRTFSPGFLGYIPVESPLPLDRVVHGALYDVSWPGGPDLPAGDVSSSLMAPDPIAMTVPASFGTSWPLNGPLDLAWTPATGTGSDGLWIMVTVSSTADPTQAYTVLCAPLDDGSFRVPGSYIDQLPNGQGTLGVMRFLSNEPPLPDGSVGLFSGTTSHFRSVAK